MKINILLWIMVNGSLNTSEVLQRKLKLPFNFLMPSLCSSPGSMGMLLIMFFSVASTRKLAGTNYFLYLIFSAFSPIFSRKLFATCPSLIPKANV